MASRRMAPAGCSGTDLGKADIKAASFGASTALSFLASSIASWRRSDKEGLGAIAALRGQKARMRKITSNFLRYEYQAWAKMAGPFWQYDSDNTLLAFRKLHANTKFCVCNCGDVQKHHQSRNREPKRVSYRARSSEGQAAKGNGTRAKGLASPKARQGWVWGGEKTRWTGLGWSTFGKKTWRHGKVKPKQCGGKVLWCQKHH